MSKKFDTICAQAGNSPESDDAAVTSSIQLSTTFHYDATGEPPVGLLYSRENNPNRKHLEGLLAQLEHGVDAAAFSSGSAAAHAVFLSLNPGDHVIINNDAYAGTRSMLKNVFIPWGLEVSFVDLTDLNKLQSSINNNTKLVWSESPTNPQLNIVDLQALIAICKEHGIRTAIDNTFATPCLQNPLLMDADIVMHSTTKYLGGHSDLTGGVLITREKNDWWQKIRYIQHVCGSVPGPFDCWLLTRGIRSLGPRMKLHVENAKAVAEFLNNHVAVERVLYPGIDTHPGYEIAKRQMKSPGAIVSFLVKGDKDNALKVARRVKVFTNATSLGGTESLLEHRKSVEGPDSPTPDNLIRLSVGLEDADDLISDLDQALN
ncbi:MAG: aminotransferase class I/II-fold pyridoxal phosphate-dependent enzyme [Chryseolinea sp.]